MHWSRGDQEMELAVAAEATAPAVAATALPCGHQRLGGSAAGGWAALHPAAEAAADDARGFPPKSLAGFRACTGFRQTKQCAMRCYAVLSSYTPV